MIAIGLLFWWPVLADAPRSVPTLGRIAYVFAAFVLSAFLGLALTFAPPLYGYYESLPERLWGISAAQDQNLGGILMTTEQALVFFAAIVWLLVRLFREEDEAERRCRRSSAPRGCSSRSGVALAGAREGRVELCAVGRGLDRGAELGVVRLELAGGRRHVREGRGRPGRRRSSCAGPQSRSVLVVLAAAEMRPARPWSFVARPLAVDSEVLPSGVSGAPRPLMVCVKVFVSFVTACAASLGEV